MYLTIQGRGTKIWPHVHTCTHTHTSVCLSCKIKEQGSNRCLVKVWSRTYHGLSSGSLMQSHMKRKFLIFLWETNSSSEAPQRFNYLSSLQDIPGDIPFQQFDRQREEYKCPLSRFSFQPERLVTARPWLSYPQLRLGALFALQVNSLLKVYENE